MSRGESIGWDLSKPCGQPGAREDFWAGGVAGAGPALLRAERVCRSCPLLQECGAEVLAMDPPPQHGVWAGMIWSKAAGRMIPVSRSRGATAENPAVRADRRARQAAREAQEAVGVTGVRATASRPPAAGTATATVALDAYDVHSGVDEAPHSRSLGVRGFVVGTCLR